MTTSLDALEKLARAATPGPWRYWTEGGEHGVDLPSQNSDYPDASTTVYFYGRGADAAFIAAANPAALLELVERLRAAKAIVRDLAAKEPRLAMYNGGSYDQCGCCGANDLEQLNRWLTDTDPKDYGKRPDFKLPHTDACPWRRAVEAMK